MYNEKCYFKDFLIDRYTATPYKRCPQSTHTTYRKMQILVIQKLPWYMAQP